MCSSGNFSIDELDFIEKVSSTYKMKGSTYTCLKRAFAVRALSRFMKHAENGRPEGKALELGCADGFETELLSGLVEKLDVVDGSLTFIEACRAVGHTNVRFFHTLFEEYSVGPGEEKYDYIFASYVLEHVSNAKNVLDMVKSSLKPEGLFFVLVPNARALSRQLAQQMNIFSDLKALTENDINHGHRRVYDMPDFVKEIENSGFEIVAAGGLLFKLLADFQMDKLLDDGFLTIAHIEGLYRLGFIYPDFADSLYAVCRERAY